MSELRFHVPKMDCATEKNVIAHQLATVDGIQHVEFDLIDRVVIVTPRDGNDVADAVAAALEAIDMAPERLGEGVSARASGRADHDHDDDHEHGAVAWLTRHRDALLLTISGACAVAAEVVAWASGSEQSVPGVALAVLAIIAGAPKTFRKAVVAARTLTLNINLLMLIAVVGALAIQEWPEAAMVTFLFACAEVIEVRSVDRARNAIRTLMVLAPETTRVRRDENWVEVDTATIARGQTIQVRPGERVPLDGRIVAGKTSIDQAPITGESIPVDKVIGDAVFAGSINQESVIEVEVTAPAGDSTLAHIARAIKQAQSERGPTERFVDRFARLYTPIVVVLALGVAVVPALVGQPFTLWLYRALVLLVIACPCALVISTPVTIVSGLAAATRHGLVVKGGTYLEQARRLRVIAMDKTGTLTEGHPRLTDVVTLGTHSRDDILQRAAALEATSTHPLARAVVTAYGGTALATRDVTAIHGKGIEGNVGDEHLAIGSHQLAHERGVCTPQVERILTQLEGEGKSIMVMWRGVTVLEPLGVIGVADTVRETSVDAIRRLHALGVRSVMLTGDNPTTARAVAKHVGIDDVAAELLPEDKLARIDELVKKEQHVGMIGDGVNDGPALARASIGFAMGAAGSDTALETADVALMGDDLRGVPALIELSHRTARTLWINIGLSLGIKLVFFALALTGLATLWMAVFADMGASLIVAVNGLRLVRA